MDIRDQRGRGGCYLILAALIAILSVLAFIGFQAEPGNETQEDIQASPTSGV